MNHARLLIDPPASGSWNMAVDQAILESLEVEPIPTLRFYRWSPATLSLGYFQKYSERTSHTSSQGIDVVRRSSGGGAIVHDRELTYGLFVPIQGRWEKRNQELYEGVHATIIDFLAALGIEASIQAAQPRDVAKNAFLCFERRTAGDIILNGFKVGGSAQRRSRSALLQHGSVLLHRSEFAPELPGISELADRNVEFESLSRYMADRISDWLRLDFRIISLSDSLQQRVSKIQNQVFDNPDWTQNR